jgi:hypothetical protein
MGAARPFRQAGEMWCRKDSKRERHTIRTMPELRAARGDEVEIVVISKASHDLTLPDGTLTPPYERKLVGWLAARSSS